MSAPKLGEILKTLKKHDVPFVLIGGWAVIFHGFVRATKDIDALIPDTPQATNGALAALIEMKATTLNGQAVEKLKTPFASGGIRVQTEYGKLDLLLEGESPLTFEEVSSSAEKGTLFDMEVPIVDLPHLVAFKRLANRQQDKVDLMELAARLGELPELP